jgi:DNA invertase Pin-like site-specific DNA recombinase
MLIRQGMPLKKVAELFDSTYEVVRRLAKRQGVELEGREKRLTPEQQQEARALVRSGVSLRQAARKVGISRCALEGLLQAGKQEWQ